MEKGRKTRKQRKTKEMAHFLEALSNEYSELSPEEEEERALSHEEEERALSHEEEEERALSHEEEEEEEEQEEEQVFRAAIQTVLHTEQAKLTNMKDALMDTAQSIQRLNNSIDALFDVYTEHLPPYITHGSLATAYNPFHCMLMTHINNSQHAPEVMVALSTQVASRKQQHLQTWRAILR